VLVLLGAKRAMSLAEIVSEVPGYSANKTAYRGAFERDKKLLREEGIDIETVEIGGEAQTGYRINESAFYLPDLDLTESEQRALAVAVAGVGDTAGYGKGALAKFGAGPAGVVPAFALLTTPSYVDELFDAVRTASLVKFFYDGVERSVCPASLRSANGQWYLTGYAIERSAPRVFRVDRIDGPPDIEEPGTGSLPDGYDRGAEFSSLVIEASASDEEPTMVIAVDETAAGRVTAELGPTVRLMSREDGRLDVSLQCGNQLFARNWVLSLRDRAEVLSPPTLRSDLMAWLEAMSNAPEPLGSKQLMESLSEPAVFEMWAPGGTEPGGRTRGELRFRRLLAMMTFLAQVGEATIAELAERFELSEREVVAELELAACCGQPPYTPDALLDIMVDDERVVAKLPSSMATPRRLNRREGFALSASAHLIAAIEGDPMSPLATGLAKLDAVLGTVEVLVVDVEHREQLDVLRRAVAEHRQLEIAYYVASRDEMTTRVINPLQVFLDGGHGYVEAFCEDAKALRLFRVDRIDWIDDVGTQPDGLPEPLSGPGLTVEFLDEAPTVILRVRDGARWIADSVPAQSVQIVGEEMMVELAAASMPWLESLLLMGGPDVSVVAPPEYVGLQREAAQRILERYRATS
ncbi:MAG: WYL domain-containing protein, partial [Actinomycetota bacterium]